MNIEKTKLVTENIFLTGATGILGSYTLKELLLNTNTIIYCLVRATDMDNALVRLMEPVLIYGEEDRIRQEFSTRVVPVIGDITVPNLQLKTKQYNELTNIIDVSIHMAASTNLSKPFEKLKAINVGGVQNMIAFALKTKQKYMSYISTYGILGDLFYSSGVVFKENDFDLDQNFPKMGYQKSKFESEKLIREAADQGLKWNICRPGNIFGESTTGIYPFGLTNVSGIFNEFMEMTIKTGLAIDGANYFDITPVDYVAKSILFLCLERNSLFETYHLVNPNQKKYVDVVKVIIELGYKIKFVSFDQFIELIVNNTLKYRPNEDKQNVTKLFKEKIIKEGFENDAVTDATYTESILKPQGIECPEIDEQLMKTYLDFYVTKGLIPVPN